MLNLSEITFTGEIVKADRFDDHYILDIKNMVNGKAETHYTTFVPTRNILDTGPGDYVYIRNATAFQKNDKFLFKLKDTSQLSLIKKGNLNLGNVDAKDKFI